MRFQPSQCWVCIDVGYAPPLTGLLVPRISLEKDTKVTNAATFTLQREDHTIGNLVRM